MSLKYETPDKYYFRIHHIRPRFKNAVESVLIYVATEISKLSKMDKKKFMESVNQAIRLYPGNITKTDKAINNWRTEISSLFGFIEYDSRNNFCWPGAMAKNLAKNQDLIEFFKYFLCYFQYPGAHLKPHEVIKYIQNGIKFQPAKYALNLLSVGEEITGARFGITKAELTHCVFNDLRVTKDGRNPQETANIILGNRKKNLDYDWRGDVIRYAGDILDYMVLADLLTRHGSMYYLNKFSPQDIFTIRHNSPQFNDYDSLYGNLELTPDDVNRYYDNWFHHVNTQITPDTFKTDVFQYHNIDISKYAKLGELVETRIGETLERRDIKTKDIGDLGECLIHGHECMKIKKEGRKDLIHLIQKIPESYAIGYDIQSIELDETKRYIEVKTTISRGSLSFNRFQMTPNEWKTAETLDGRYFIYRLMISKNEMKLFVICDPVKKYKTDDKSIKMTPGATIDIKFEEKSGDWEELLLWEN